MTTSYAFLNGSFIPLEEAKVGILDLGVLRSYGVYEGITVINGKPFRYEDHWQRFLASAAALNLTIPVSRDEFERALIDISEKNAPGERMTVRVVLTGGEALGGLEHVPGRETFFINAEPTSTLPEAVYTQGASVITNEHQRFMPQYKTIVYLNAVLMQPKRRATGALEILYHDKGLMLECATSNAFIVKDGKLATPKSNILHGITRKVIIELATEAGYQVEEREVTMEEAFGADELFITSSFKDIAPIVRIDDEVLADGKVGAVSKEMIKRFREYAGI